MSNKRNSKIKIKCPGCGRTLRGITDKMLGDVGVCAKCMTEFIISESKVEIIERPHTSSGQDDLKTIDISGFFRIEIQTRKSRIAWIFGIPIGGTLFVLGIWWAIEILQNLGPSTPLSPTNTILYVIFLLILAPLIALVGLFKAFQKPGVYFTGIKTTESGFEAGALTVDLSSVTWRGLFSGTIIRANWEPEKPIIAPSLTVHVFVKESRDFNQCYFIDRLLIASDKDVLHQVKSAKNTAETNVNNLVTMLNGDFELLGGMEAISYRSFLAPLQRIAEVLSTSTPDNPPSCTLNLIAKTVRLAESLPFGLIGGLISAGIDSRRRHKLRERLKQHQLFDVEFTDKLLEFVDKHGWSITAGDGLS